MPSNRTEIHAFELAVCEFAYGLTTFLFPVFTSSLFEIDDDFIPRNFISGGLIIHSVEDKKLDYTDKLVNVRPVNWPKHGFMKLRFSLLSGPRQWKCFGGRVYAPHVKLSSASDDHTNSGHPICFTFANCDMFPRFFLWGVNSVNRNSLMLISEAQKFAQGTDA